jgi:hypothetical protein
VFLFRHVVLELPLGGGTSSCTFDPDGGGDTFLLKTARRQNQKTILHSFVAVKTSNIISSEVVKKTCNIQNHYSSYINVFYFVQKRIRSSYIFKQYE